MQTTSRATLVGVALLFGVETFAAWQVEGPFAGSVNDLAFSAAHPETVYAATSYGGVWRSDDGGRTWQLPGEEMTRRDVRWVEVDPTDEARLWAGLGTRGGRPAMWRSNDRGVSWEAITSSSGSATRLAPVGQPIAFAAPSTIYVPSTNLHYRSDDGGKTWHDFRVPNQDAYVFAVHPSDPGVVLAGGRGETLNVSRSTDRGKTWKQTGLGLGKNRVRSLFFDPVNPGNVYAVAGTFGSVFKSSNGGDSWTELSLPIGGTSRVFDLSLDPTDPKVLWAATQEGLLVSGDGGATWRESGHGFGRFLATTIAFDPRDSRRMLAGTGGTGVYRSADGGATWSPSSQGLAAGWTEALYGSERSATVFAQMNVGLFRRDPSGAWTEVVRPFEEHGPVELDGIVFDRRSRETLYAFDTSRYWHSSDSGRSWTEVEQKGPSMRQMMKGNLDSAQFASFVQDPGNPKVFFAGSWSSFSAGGAVFKTVDGGKKWKPSGQGLPAGERVTMLRSAAPGAVFALVAKQGLFRTADGGASWRAAGSGLPDAEIYELVVDPTGPPRLYAATAGGLFRSTDTGATWERSAAGIDGDDVAAVAVDPASGAVFAGTFQGVFRSSDGGLTWNSIADGLRHRDVRCLAVAGSPPRLWAGTAGGSVHSTAIATAVEAGE